ncbi:MAG: hypothetical protein M3Q06_14055 [Bacteroidota bacterium]|nr:hypothetical protein [Bacteroidota bacterium]
MRYSINILTLASILTLFSCDRIKRKGDAVVDKTKQAASATKLKISNKVNNEVDNVFPTYDNGKADTENNKKRFKEHLQVDLTSDVKNIYAYGDFLGADYKVLIAFVCDKATFEKIIAVKKMQLTTSKDDDGLFFLEEFKWWDKDKIELLEPYKVGKEAEYWQYLWYDPKTRQTFYEEYSL